MHMLGKQTSYSFKNRYDKALEVTTQDSTPANTDRLTHTQTHTVPTTEVMQNSAGRGSRVCVLLAKYRHMKPRVNIVHPPPSPTPLTPSTFPYELPPAPSTPPTIKVSFTVHHLHYHHLR